MGWFILRLILILGTMPAWALNTHGPGVDEHKAWWGDAFQGYVRAGCLHATSGNTTVSVPACQAYARDTQATPQLQYLAESGSRSVTFSAGDGTYFLVGRANPAVTPGGWTCVAGTAYCWLKFGTSLATLPPIPAGTVLLSGATVAGGAVTVVADFRRDTAVRDGPVNVRSPLYGVVADCTTPTDTTVALQGAINAGLWQKRDIYIPQGCYSVGRLWFNFDATLNPKAPNILRYHGRITIYGDGPLTTANVNNNDLNSGTILKSTETTLNAFNITHTSTDFTQFYFQDMTLFSTTAAWVLHIQRCVINCNVSRITIKQDNPLGLGGALIEDTFIINWEDVFILGANEAAADPAPAYTGVGIWLKHSTSTGGLNLFQRVTTRQFNTCWRIGDIDPPSTSDDLVLRDTTFFGSQVGDCDTGVYVGTNASSVNFIGNHNEFTVDFGYFLTGGSHAVNIIGGAIGCINQVLPQNACIRIGDSTTAIGTDGGATTINIVGVEFQTVRTRSIDIQDDPSIGQIFIGTNYHNGNNALAQMIRCENAPNDPRGVVILPQTQVGTFSATPISGCSHVFRFDQHFFLPGRMVHGVQSDTDLASAASVTPTCDGNVYRLTGNTTINTIVTTGTCGVTIPLGTRLFFYLGTGAGPITIDSGAGNIRATNNTDVVLTQANDGCEIMRAESFWIVLSCKTQP